MDTRYEVPELERLCEDRDHCGDLEPAVLDELRAVVQALKAATTESDLQAMTYLEKTDVGSGLTALRVCAGFQLICLLDGGMAMLKSLERSSEGVVWK